MAVSDPLIIVINLERDVERLAHFARQLQPAGLDWERIDAIDGRTVDPASYSEVDLTSCHRNLGRAISPNEIACSLSHRRALDHFLKTDAPCALILEDDAIVDDPSYLKQVLADLTASPSAWDCVKLSGKRPPLAVPLEKLESGATLSAALLRQSDALAYLVNRRAARGVLDNMLPIDCCYDHLLDQPWRYRYRYRSVLPFPVRQDFALGTSIGHKPKKRPFYRRGGTLIHRFGMGLNRLIYNLRNLLYLRERKIADRNVDAAS